MAVSNPTLRTTFTTDAEFREWAQAVHDALVAVGMTQTADTGQVNLATVAKPTSTGVYMGYEVFRFSDTLQATKPVYIKVEYGSAQGGATRPGVAVTVGTGTNGAGTLTGQVGTRMALYPSADPSVGTGRFSGANNRLTFCLYPDGAGAANVIFFSVERTKDAAGADNGDGLHSTGVGASSVQSQTIPYSGTISGVQSALATPLPPGESTAVNGSDVVVFSVFPVARVSRNPVQNLVTYLTADISGGTTISVDPDGAGAKSYYCAGALGTTVTSWNSSARLAFRYE